jgi:hypothetical protein
VALNDAAVLPRARTSWATRRPLPQRLADRLDPVGLLFTGHAGPAGAGTAGCEALGQTVYRRLPASRSPGAGR